MPVVSQNLMYLSHGRVRGSERCLPAGGRHKKSSISLSSKVKHLNTALQEGTGLGKGRPRQQQLDQFQGTELFPSSTVRGTEWDQGDMASSQKTKDRNRV